MATQTIRVCDFNHGKAPAEARTIKVSIAGEGFSIDLCADHEKELKSALTRFERAANRPKSGRGPAGRAGKATGTRARAALRVADLTEAERAFAKRAGWGGKRLSNDVIAKIQERRKKS